jgi:hypothetical protein
MPWEQQHAAEAKSRGSTAYTLSCLDRLLPLLLLLLLLLLLSRRLCRIIQDYVDHFSPSHAAAAVSVLAGQVTGRALSHQELAGTFQGPAAQAAAAFQDQLDQAAVKDCAQ